MSDSRPLYGKSSAPGALAMQASGDGFWELNLADGSAWFSDWFCPRLPCSDPMRRLAFDDLRPLMNSDTWHSLLREMRWHLEELRPLDTEFPVHLAEGKTEWWHLRGSAQRNDAGHPTYFAGCVRDISADRATPKTP